MNQSNNTPDARRAVDRLLGRLIGGDPTAEADVLRLVEHDSRLVEPSDFRLVEASDFRLVERVETTATTDPDTSSTTQDVPTVGLLVAGAVLAGDLAPLMRASSLATTARERQLVVLARACLSGPADLFDDLIRDHLATYPDHLLAAWLAGRRN